MTFASEWASVPQSVKYPQTRANVGDVIYFLVDDIYAEIELSWRNGQFHLPLKFVDFHKSGKL